MLSLHSCVAVIVTAITVELSLAAVSQISPLEQPGSTDTNAKAHAVLEMGRKVNGLDGEGLKPWHMKVEYRLPVFMSLNGEAKEKVREDTGTLEIWSAGPYKRRYTYTGGEVGKNGTEWSLSRTERYQTGKPLLRFDPSRLDGIIANPVVHPMYVTSTIHPDHELELKQVNAGLALNCVSVVNPGRYSGDMDPDEMYPSTCFDDHSVLRLKSSDVGITQYSDFQVFQNRAVARKIRTTVRGSVVSEMNVTLLEELPAIGPDRLTPPKDALREPYHRETGDPLPLPVFQVAASIPLSEDLRFFHAPASIYQEAASTPHSPDHNLFRDVAFVAVVIQKDGSVTILPNQYAFNAVFDAVSLAMTKWRYQPYTIDGQVVEVATELQYPLHMRPFVPEYDRQPEEKVVTAPGDFSSAYDPKRQPAKDLEMAVKQARQQHKRVLMIVGGDWSIWCKNMDKFLATDAEVQQILSANFVLLKVNMSEHNRNGRFLSQFPEVPSYPFLFLIDSDEKLIAAQRSDDLENGADSYSEKSFTDFLLRWSRLHK